MTLIILAGAASVAAWFFLRPTETRTNGQWMTLPGTSWLSPLPTVTTPRKTPNEWRAELMPLIRRQEHALVMPAGLLEAVIENESSFRHDIITGQTEGSAGEQGIMQLKPQFHMDSAAERNNPYLAIKYGATYLAKNFLRFGNWREAVIAYNCGPTDWENYGAAACGPALNYVAKVEARVGALA